MKRTLILIIHITCAITAFCLLASFWISTIVSTILQDLYWITIVKKCIVYCMTILIPLLVCTAITGKLLAGDSTLPIIKRKILGMRVIALNGVIVLLPSAIVLLYLANNNLFNSRFWMVEILELIFGAINITLMFLNIRSGLEIRRNKLFFNLKYKISR